MPSRQIAEGQSVALKAHSSNALSYIWFLNGEPLNGEHDERLIVNTGGLYTVIGLNGNCASGLSDPIEIIIKDEAPPVEVDIQISKLVDPQSVLVDDDFEYQLYVVNNSEHVASEVKIIDQLSHSLSYQHALLGYMGQVRYLEKGHQVIWEMDSLSAGKSEELRIRVKAKKGGWVENTATVQAKEADPDPSNNRASVSKQVSVFKIPNAFTPNGDGVNDYFEIEALPAFPENEMMIFNRWGNMVHQQKSYQNDWQGSGLNEGTYYYILRVQIAGKWNTFKGYITLVRG